MSGGHESNIDSDNNNSSQDNNEKNLICCPIDVHCLNDNETKDNDNSNVENDKNDEIVDNNHGGSGDEENSDEENDNEEIDDDDYYIYDNDELDFSSINDTVKEFSYKSLGKHLPFKKQGKCKNIRKSEPLNNIIIHFNGSTRPLKLSLHRSCCEYCAFTLDHHIDQKFKYSEGTDTNMFVSYNNLNSIIGKKIVAIERDHEQRARLNVGYFNHSDYCIDSVKIIIIDDSGVESIVRIWINIISNGFYSSDFRATFI